MRSNSYLVLIDLANEAVREVLMFGLPEDGGIVVMREGLPPRLARAPARGQPLRPGLLVELLHEMRRGAGIDEDSTLLAELRTALVRPTDEEW